MSSRSRHAHYVMSSGKHRCNVVACGALCETHRTVTRSGKLKCSGLVTINRAKIIGRDYKGRKIYACQSADVEVKT